MPVMDEIDDEGRLPTEVALSWRDIKDVLDHDSDELGALIDLAFGKFLQVKQHPGEFTVVLSAKLVRITS